MINLKEILTVGMILFAVIDIIGSVPIIIALKKKVGHIQSEKASIVSVIIMIAFLFIGEEILNIIGIDVNSFAVAGSFVIFFMSLEMVLGISLYKNETPETASIVPIAFPIIGFVFYLGGQAIMKGFKAKDDNRAEKQDENETEIENTLSNNDQLSNEITKLNELLQSGILTQEEFEKAKKKILDN